MAVYTRFSEDELNIFLKNYTLGTLVKTIEIEQGVENSNYFLTTTTGKYVLTIYEKRVDVKDLPYFLSFSDYLKGKNINTPSPIKNNNNEPFTDFKHKKAAIITFLEGHNLTIPNQEQCASAGEFAAKMHLAQVGFTQKRTNQLSPTGSLWQIYESIKLPLKEKMPDIYDNIVQEIDFLKEHYPQDNLEIGNIHADIFPDNMFFNNNKAIGIIDFYFSCTDFIAYDLSIILCAWTFDKGTFQPEKFKALLNAYQSVRKLTNNELNNLIILMRGAAMRFFLTRAYDFIFHDKNALVKAKDPYEYFNIIHFLQTKSTTISNQILAS